LSLTETKCVEHESSNCSWMIEIMHIAVQPWDINLIFNAI